MTGFTSSFPTRKTYLSEEDYWSDGVIGAARKYSDELDHGAWWYEGPLRRFPIRVTFVEAAGEVIAVFLAGEYRDQIEVLASGMTKADVRLHLERWAEHCGEPDSLQWVRNQLRDFPPRLDS